MVKKYGFFFEGFTGHNKNKNIPRPFLVAIVLKKVLSIVILVLIFDYEYIQVIV